ncbi:MAG: hypothetical protein H6602_06010 [Flavobacteriales bacterium]|nr:hypothetical protein [Flavobacteriales bacterium]
MRVEHIFTKVRPIKKMFVIEPSDYKAFSKIFKDIQSEVDSIHNLVFVNDDDLWSQVNTDFIKRCDPDIILNMSTLSNDVLSHHFGILTEDPAQEMFKIVRFGTSLMTFTRTPKPLRKFGFRKKSKIDVLTAQGIANTPESLFDCINFGWLTKDTQEHLSLSIFKKVNPLALETSKDSISRVFDNSNKFNYLTEFLGSFSGSGRGSSIYEIDYNKTGLFESQKEYIIFSDSNDFKSISFFWNTRSYYSGCKLAWFPIEMIKLASSLIGDNTVCVCPNPEVKRLVEQEFPTAKIECPSRLHFRGRNERWTFFRHQQTISIPASEAIIQHPAEKGFCELGSLGAFVLETRGLDEFAYPKRRNLGNLFFPEHYDRSLTPERFRRISELGVSQYVLQISPLRSEDVTEVLVLPKFDTVVRHLFEDVGFQIVKTQKASILEQAVNLLGGIENIGVLANRKIFDSLIKLTPVSRTEKAIKKVLKKHQEPTNSDKIIGVINEMENTEAVSFPVVTSSVRDIVDNAGLTRDDKTEFLSHLQSLCDQKALLRGKYFKCPHCESHLWIRLEDIERMNYCNECNNEVSIPIYKGHQQSTDHFRLNRLIKRAIDQGQLSTLLLVNFIREQQQMAFSYQSNIEILDNGEPYTDVDLFIRLGRKIGVAECKSTGGFQENQIDALIEIAMKLKCSFVMFSSLSRASSNEIVRLTDYLKAMEIKIPAFILSSEVLFNPRPRTISRYFELVREDEFPVGPILIPET